MQNLECQIESTNTGWNKSVPFEGTRPRQDYSVGFRRTAFSMDQVKKLDLQFDNRTYSAAMEEMYFPFLTCEVKCGSQALDIADRQNAHSMTVAVRGVVELYQSVGRGDGLHHQKFLAFSISHDHRNVRIYAHYPEIEGLDTKYYRHLLQSFDIANEDGKDRWVSSQFTRNVYDSFVPIHRDRIKSAVDQLPAPESFLLNNTEDAVSLQETMVTSALSSQRSRQFQKAGASERGWKNCYGATTDCGEP